MSEIIENKKECRDCKKIKFYSEFNIKSKRNPIPRHHCKICQSVYRKKYHSKKENKQKSNEQSVSYYKQNVEKIAKRVDKNKEKRNRKYRERYANDIQFNWHVKLNSRLNDFINYSSRKYSKTLGSSRDFFIGYIEFQFYESMNWNNKGQKSGQYPYWEIEHIIGYSAFNLEDPHERMLCTHWTNIQIMWGYENKKKRNYIQLHQFMNSIITAHRYIQKTKKEYDGYKIIRKKIEWFKMKYPDILSIFCNKN